MLYLCYAVPISALTCTSLLSFTWIISLRLITDYKDYYKDIYTSLLLSYELRPGTVFYFGIDDNQEQDDSGIYKVQGRFVFVKFSYWWRI